MSCRSELTYAIYLDGELPPEEARQVELHLSTCPGCRDLVEALRAENQLLLQVLQETPAEGLALAEAPGQLRLLDLAWTTAAVIGAAMLLRAAFDWLADVQLPQGLNWLNPFSVTVQWQLFFSSLFYFLQEGAAMLVTSAMAIGVLALVVLIVGGSFYLLRGRPAGIAVLATFCLAFVLAQPGAAVDIRKAPAKAIVIAEGEVVDDTLYFRGETLIVNGTINGNLIAFAERVEINGTVKGDLICFAGKALLNGTVESNAFVFAHVTDVSGRVGRNLHSFASSTQVAKGGLVEGDAITLGGDASVDGTVGRDVVAFAGSTSVQGTVGRNLQVWTGRLSVLGPARIGGKVDAHVKKQKYVQIDPGAAIAGKVETHLPPSRLARYGQPRFYFWQAARLAGALLAGLLLFWLFPALLPVQLDAPKALLKNLGIGFVTLVATPVFIILAAITLVGLGIALLTLASWLAGLYLAKILVGMLVGRSLLAAPAGQAPSVAMPLLLGLAVVFVAINIPYVGGLIHILALLLGLGMVVLQLYSAWQQTRTA